MSNALENSNNTQPSSEILTEHTLYAETVGHIGNFSITNSLLTSWAAVIILIIFAIAIKRSLKKVPTGLQNLMELLIEGFLGIFDSVTGDRKVSLRFTPLILAFFFFILLNNWLGIIPGVGSIGQVVIEGGHRVFVPFLRGGTADINTTLALASIAIVLSHIFSILALGFWTYFNKFINIKALLEIPKKIFKDPSVLLINPIKFFVGIIEIVGEVAKVASLSFRLFGNVFAGEVLLASISAIMAFGVPLPFLFLEVAVGLIQALIFSLLVLTYFTMGISKEEH